MRGLPCVLQDSFPPEGQCLVRLGDDSGHTVYICLVERLEGLRKAVKVQFGKVDKGRWG